MTLNDLLQQGVTIQGQVQVASFDESYIKTVHFDGDMENETWFDEPWAETEVKFMWADSERLHIEVEDLDLKD